MRVLLEVQLPVQPVRIGNRTNIQDLSVLHVTTDRYPCVIGDDVTVGHGAVLHGCRVADRVLIGMGAVLLDGVEVGEDAALTDACGMARFEEVRHGAHTAALRQPGVVPAEEADAEAESKSKDED